MQAQDRDCPEGYVPHFRKSAVTDPWEPLYAKKSEGVVQIGMRIRAAHCNGRGFLHGGVVAALADNAMGLSVIETMLARGPDRFRAGVTLSLVVNYVAPGKIGQWFEVVPRVINARRSTAFTKASLLADGEVIAQATACFRIFVSKEHHTLLSGARDV